MGVLREVKWGGRLCGSWTGPREGYSCQSSHMEGAGRGLFWGHGGWAPGSSSEGPTFSQWQKREGCVLQQLEWK